MRKQAFLQNTRLKGWVRTRDPDDVKRGGVTYLSLTELYIQG